MKRFYALLALLFLFGIMSPSAQVKNPKTSSTIFFQETFDWEDSSVPLGWRMPPTCYLEDPNDTGFNWHWWPNDSLISLNTTDPPFQSTSKEDGHLCLFGGLYNNVYELVNYQEINNSIVFTGIDCSDHASVILQFETSFSNRGIPFRVPGGWECLVEVSGDNGLHWSAWDAGFDIRGSDRPDYLPPGEPALFRINITEVVAGMSDVMVRINWYSYFGRYFWIIDDMQLSEAWQNDLRLDKIDVRWDDKIIGIDQSISYMIPIHQLGKGHSFEVFNSLVSNMGASEATDLVFNVTIKKEDEIVFHEAKTMPSLYPGYQDSLILDGTYEPTEKGSYSIQYKWQHDQEDDFPDDNERTLFYHVSDSVYNRAGDQPDFVYYKGSGQYRMDEWGFHANVNHFMGSVFPIYGDCEIDGISAYIMGGLADGLIDFAFTIWRAEHYIITHNVVIPIFLMKTERLFLDSSMFNTWVYLPFEKDGETEFVEAGSLLWAGIEYSNYHSDETVRRTKNISIGATSQASYTGRYLEARSKVGAPHNSTLYPTAWSDLRNQNLMIRLYLTGPESSSITDYSKGSSISLTQNFPNPFTDQTRIDYRLDQGSFVKLEVTDLTGHVILIKDVGMQPVGSHQMFIESSGLSPGIYFYTLYAGSYRKTKKMIVSYE